MQNAVLVGLFLWLAPVLAVAAGGLGLPRTPALLVGVPIAALVAAWASRVLLRRLGPDSLPRPLAIALLVAASIAIVRIATISVFIADVNRVEAAVEPHDEFRRIHSCMSAYAESARFLSEGDHNIYERTLYRSPDNTPRRIGPLGVDPFHYPPPFLLLPQALRVVAPDFWHFRRLWFAIQALVLAGAIVGLAAWIGGRRGAIGLAGGAMLLALPHSAATMQIGNFQITAVPLGVLAFVMLMAGRAAVGATVLAYAALAKIFPGILIVPLIAGRDWRRCAWVAGAGVLLLLLTVGLQGTQPFRDFVSTALPEISSGAAFPQTENPQHASVIWSAYGQSVRLRLLGVTALTQRRGLALAEVYGIAVVALAAWVGWRRRFDLSDEAERVALVMMAIALVSLAALRSPFAGAAYGALSTLWVMAVAAAATNDRSRQVAWLVGLVVLGGAVWMVPSPGVQADPIWIPITGVLVLACMAINVWAVATVARSRATDYNART